MNWRPTSAQARIWGSRHRKNYSRCWAPISRASRFSSRADDLHPGDSPYAVLGYRAGNRDSERSAIVGKTISIHRSPVRSWAWRRAIPWH